MADSKAPYSAESSRYVTGAREVPELKREYEKSLARKAKHGNVWAKNPANLNEVVDRFAPGARGEARGGKYIYTGSRYSVIADMGAGYLRIWDSVLRCYVRLDGRPDKDRRTHFRILKKGEY